MVMISSGKGSSVMVRDDQLWLGMVSYGYGQLWLGMVSYVMVSYG